MADIRTLHQSLHQSVASKDYPRAAGLLSKLKLALLEHNALIPSHDIPAQALIQARDILEVGAVVSIHLNDEAAFLRYYAQLQPFYASTALEATPSANKNKIAGLYLLLLLTKNNIADFHTTLENLPDGEDDAFVRYPVMLEQWLMEGSYDKVWQATKSSQVPSEEYAKFSQVLVGTIRHEIASCSEKAYASLPVSNAKQLLFLESEGAVVQFAQEREWEVRDGRIYFPVEEGEKEALSSNRIIENTIGYAQELETIV
ncbi:SAC3/GANP/Nin1/mts3/eIF-3 p25 family-domain-containing protein [Sphaerosporella brunnea]|uniref:SAC3/GANP/Nin1/mts3/eIF-3 p25 family-domain-containing protein n=1 Tax=Sphaerosporella brunnea TaxID=1250544 RepID=A0A5J5F213_9PEZI|nr:SAC3/GANP/Nin1/mts3/eIF-3 p25 family-domain-containing protein [Sphaerosporella brunnea]